MADFISEFPALEDFPISSNTNANLESDFLAREQALLGADAALFSNSNHTITTISDYSAFHSEFPPVEVESQALYSNSNGKVPHSLSSDNNIHDTEEEEPEIIRQWKERQREIIAQRDEASETKKRETLSIARDAIDKFYEEYNEKKARTHEQNKQDEETFLRERDDLTSGTSWERICKQVDLSTAQSKSTNKHVKDVSRFKELLLSLKKDEKAPGAGGY
ncbi:clathrin light chain [Rhizophagus clarus]|uniref:Clathrin light chain n=1 Tax=Rhizophagus clarus TaxID=94130 RepID=A0A8H3LFA9_9GLOM|nr:clathrin light chain [Rhizophagus clarus]